MTSINPRQLRRSECQVLVVGSGPTGLVLACELLARGIATRVIDKGDGLVLQSRALAVHARALEVLDMMGLAERFLAEGQIVRRFHLYTGRRTLIRLDLTRNGSRFGCMLDLPQYRTESLLRERLGELGGRVEQGVELHDLAQGPDGVTATVRDAAGCTSTITADYLVGCDGAHSRVRHALGVDYPGHPYLQDWLLADVYLDWDRPDDEFHAFFRREGLPLICMPMRQHYWRVIIPYAGDRDGRVPTLTEVQQHVAERAPQPVTISDPAWLATFRCQRRSTSTYRRGRVLLAGDAVHVHSPAGGQGMNTGIIDAHNLGWKLALVATSHAPDRLLDSYAAERGPVAADVLALTHALVRLGTLTRPLSRACRDTLVPFAGKLAPIQRPIVRRLGQLHVTYAASPLTQPAPGRGLRPGQRVPDFDVATADGPTRLYQLLRKGRHVIYTPADTLPELQQRLRYWHAHIDTVTPLTSTSWRAPGLAGRVCLIRPDGYLATCAAAAQPDALLTYLQQIFADGDPTDRDAATEQRTGGGPRGPNQTQEGVPTIQVPTPK
jgi:2-polyprenyl-6-methoxyphenol hydroxylase-like FAD-dependent oxidoreductase